MNGQDGESEQSIGNNGRKLKQSIQKQLGVFLEDEKELIKSVFTFT